MRIDQTTRAVLVTAALLGLGAQVTAQEQLNYVSRFFPGITGAGARAMGMGGAFIAIADDATAASWNPAGLAVLERPEVSLVGQPLAHATSKEPGYTFTFNYVGHWYPGHTVDGTQTTIDHAYVDGATSRSFDFASITYPFRVGSVKLVPQISRQRVVDLGFDTAFDATGQTEDHWTEVCPWYYCPPTGSSGPYPVSRSVDMTAGGGIDVWALSLGVSFNPKVYLGLALNRWGGSSTNVTLDESTTTYPNGYWTNSSDTTTTQDFSGTSVHFGVLVKPTPKVNLGLVFRPGFGMSLESVVDRSTDNRGNRANVTPSTAQSTETRDGTLDWPRTIGAGVAVMPTDFLTVSADFTTTAWSKAIFDHHYSYQSTNRYFYERGEETSTYENEDDLTMLWPNRYDPEADNHMGPEQTDASQLRLGAEYVLKDPKVLGLVVLPLRIGFIRDGQMTTNAPDPTKATYYGVTAGFGLVWKRGSLDVAWVHMRGKSTYGFDSPEYGNSTYAYDYSYRAEGETAFTANRVFVSTVVRF